LQRQVFVAIIRSITTKFGFVVTGACITTCFAVLR
jgi:hypothetical protein